jgi:ribosomal protein L7/L12
VDAAAVVALALGAVIVVWAVLRYARRGMPDSAQSRVTGGTVQRPTGHPGRAAALNDDELRALVARGHKIQAIKQVRDATGLGLAEAKAYVEGL